MKTKVIELIGVSYAVSEGAFKPVSPIVKDMSLALEQGVSMGVIGRNGAGKTTTLKLCTGIVPPCAGTVKFDGKETLTRTFQERIGFLTENQYFPQNLTVMEWLSTLGKLSGMSSNLLLTRLNESVSLFDLEELSDRRIGTLSKGQTQRIGFAQALLHQPEILVLDEPMTGMDPLWRSRIHEVLLAFKKCGGTLLFSSHIMSDVLRLSDCLTVIDKGAIKWQGSMKDIMASTAQYRVVLNCPDSDGIGSKIIYDSIEPQPDGSLLMHIPADQKDKLMAMSIKSEISIESMTPLFPDIEEFLT